MYVPRAWIKAKGEVVSAAGETRPLAVWGWGASEGEAFRLGCRG